ncbi:tetratricopeptide repeat protein 38-like [Oppia nitens]|uniref:tetratricopeptide repeat protein 38-like n=1 Tax=Oppia nitens TaxID=1686743 RepID=UPI0023DB01E7|nr:tetratricopeptide repeat protein 38-like [Oppia nitens]
MYRTNWRSSDDWRAQGLSIKSSASDTAIKLYDAAVTQLIGWYDDPNLGGLSKTCDDMVKADPNFILGRSFSLGLELIGTTNSVRLDSNLKAQLDDLLRLTEKHRNQIEDRELKHVEAVHRFASGDWNGASNIWEEILVDYPTDIQALKFSHDALFYLGKSTQIRDSIARVLPVWDQSSLPLKSYIHGMYAFGLEETQFYDKAEREAKLALDANRNDAWATHALSHVLTMESRNDDGIQLMSSTTEDWEVCNFLACHNFWHWALFHIEKGEYEKAVQLFDSQIGRRAVENGAMLDIVDAASLLYRLDLIKPKQFTTAEHWDTVYSIIEPHLSDHIYGFNDAHFMMACLGSHHTKAAQQLVRSFDPSVSSDDWVRVTVPLLEAMIDFNDERYANAVDKLNKIRYDIIDIGGSDAQRDVFNQLLIVAALKSPKDSHKRLCQRLCAERRALNDSPFINTLLSVQ